MPQSLSNIVLHIIFSTKDCHPFVGPDLAPKLHAYLATTSRNLGSECYRAGGIADHVHLAVQLPRTLTTAKLVETLKSSSSKWLKDQSPTLKDFAWQRGYGAFPTFRNSPITSTIGMSITGNEASRMNTSGYSRS